MKRSKINANPRMEHAIRGQIGQPAACMMESKFFSAQIKIRMRLWLSLHEPPRWQLPSWFRSLSLCDHAQNLW
ncbi:MAG: hypothetical protein K2Q97_13010, partial [Burkholderiaceae bacterium]|nr:hypothetical protein [Burkholderiaceae bacterium]